MFVWPLVSVEELLLHIFGVDVLTNELRGVLDLNRRELEVIKKLILDWLASDPPRAKDGLRGEILRILGQIKP